MAKSANYYGLRSGSTKSHTYSVLDGKQITKDRVEGGKDPRTFPQMSQRCLVATIGTAYSAMKSICDHSFEDKTAGMQCMREFMSTNLNHIRVSKEYDDGLFGFNKYKEATLRAGSYVISHGSLPKALVDATVDSVNVAGKKLTLTLTTTASGSTAEVTAAMGCRKFDDICTVAVMYPKADGSYGFGAVRFTYKSGATVLDSFAVDVNGDIVSATPAFTSNTLKVEVRMAYELASGTTTANTYLAAITSRNVNGTWRRSSAQFNVTDATPTFAQAIATYPVGEERFLNGGQQTSGGASPSPSSGGENGGDSGTTTVAAPTISGTTPFADTTSMTISAEAGADIYYTTDGSTPTSASTQYSSAVTLSATTTVKAIAIKDGVSSSVTTKTFTKSEGGGGDDSPDGVE